MGLTSFMEKDSIAIFEEKGYKYMIWNIIIQNDKSSGHILWRLIINKSKEHRYQHKYDTKRVNNNKE